MNEKDKCLAEAVLKRLFEGARVDGIRFGPVPQILITDHATGKEPLRGQVYLNLASAWCVYASYPDKFPNGEEELPKQTTEEEIQAICALRERVIAKAELCASEPHLILTIDDGRVVFVNGKHDMYECWGAGVTFNCDEDFWMVVACPGGSVAVWAPESFVAASA